MADDMIRQVGSCKCDKGTFELHKMWDISSLTEDLITSYRQNCSTEQVILCIYKIIFAV
jgi:hypothetical protein